MYCGYMVQDNIKTPIAAVKGLMRAMAPDGEPISVDRAARQARADIAAARPIQWLIEAMALGAIDGKSISPSQRVNIAMYLGNKIAPDLKSVDVNQRQTAADPAEWLEYLHSMMDAAAEVGTSEQGVPPLQVFSFAQAGGVGVASVEEVAI